MSFGICVPRSILLACLAVVESQSPWIRSLGRPSIRSFRWDAASTDGNRHATKTRSRGTRNYYYYFVCWVEVILKTRISSSWRCFSHHWILIHWKIDARQSAESRCHCRRWGLQYISRREDNLYLKMAQDRNGWK